MIDQFHVPKWPSTPFLHKLFDSLNDIVCALDTEGRFVYLNKATHKLWGYAPEELIGTSCYDIMVKEDRDDTVDSVEDVLVPDAGPPPPFENRYLRKDGTVVIMHWEGGGYDSETGLIYSTGRDVTRQRYLERLQQEHNLALQSTKEELEQLVERITDGFLGLDLEARVIYWNKTAERISGLDRHRMIGACLWDVLPEPTRSLAYDKFVLIKESGGPLYWEYFADRIQRWIEIHAYISGTGISVFFRDVTERRELQEELVREKELQQKLITRAVIKATDEERAHVSKELHDNVNQVLTTVKLYTELCLSETEKRSELLSRSMVLLQSCIEEIRNLSKRLSSPSLGSISLKESIAELVDAINTSERVSVNCLFKAESLQLPEAVHIALYRILQEHFTNILKHAGATTVDLMVWKEKSVLKIAISDDGCGFDPAQPRKGLGLANMSSRAEAIGAKLEIQSAPGDGCGLLLYLPLETEAVKEPEPVVR